MALGKGAPAPDNSMAMISMANMSAQTAMHNSDNQLHLGMAKIGSDIMQSGQMAMLANRALSAEVNQTEDQIDAKLEIAHINYNLARSEQEDTHREHMEELSVRRLEITRGKTTDDPNFSA